MVSWVKVSLLLTVLAFVFNLVLLASRAGAQQEVQEQRRQIERLEQQLDEAQQAAPDQEREIARLKLELTEAQRATERAPRLRANDLRGRVDALLQPTSSPDAQASGCHAPLLPVPEPKPAAAAAARVRVGGKTQFTVLTEATLRIERAAQPNGFDERASFAIINRRLVPPAFRAQVEQCKLLKASARCLVIETALLRLEYLTAPNTTRDSCSHEPNGAVECEWEAVPFTEATLKVELRLLPASERRTQWWPGKANPRQLPGTVRTLDKVAASYARVCL